MSEPAVHHPVFARLYARMSPRAEEQGVAEHRDELLAGIAGRVVEVGAGNGLNFGHYPAAVTEVVAVEPEPYLRERALEAAALAEIRRVLRPGGELRFYEHVVSHKPRSARVQRFLDDRGIWPRLAGGCHCARETDGAIERAGFAIERCRRFPFGPGPFALPHLVGVARRD